MVIFFVEMMAGLDFAGLLPELGMLGPLMFELGMFELGMFELGVFELVARAA